MDENLKTLKERAKAEQRRVKNLLKRMGLSNDRIKLLSPVIEDTSWMKAKLDDSKEAIKDSQIVIKYDNGGGQKGLRENPLFKGYEALYKTYMLGMREIFASIPEGEKEITSTKPEPPTNMLAIIQARKKA